MKPLFVFALGLFFAVSTFAQTDQYSVKRTKTHSETIKFGPGGTVSIVGAPIGSIEIKGWRSNEVKIDAEIVVYADNETDAKRISDVTGFGVEESVTSLRIHSFGTHDKKNLKKVDKKFPKNLRDNPFELNYTLYVPEFTDLRIDGGSGDLIMNGVEGVFIINYFNSDARLNLVGGRVMMTVGTGSVDVTIGTRSWRGRSAEINLTRGDLKLRLPQNFNADLRASVLRTGLISNDYVGLTPKDRTKFTDKQMFATAGSGGADLSFTVGDGNLNILRLEKPSKKPE